MRSPLLVLLTLAVATAPATAVRVADTRPLEQQAAEQAREQTGADQTNGEQTGEPKQQQKQKRVPAPTELKKLTPAQTAGSGGEADDDDGPGQRPELAPALYARRLPTTPRVAEPSRAPERASIVSGHLSLPPPLS